MDTMVPGKDYYIEVLLAGLADPEATPAPVTGRTDVTAWLSTTKAGTPIGTSTPVVCSESGTRTVDGISYARYIGLFSGASTKTLLANYMDKVIYRCDQCGTNDTNSMPVRVVAA